MFMKKEKEKAIPEKIKKVHNKERERERERERDFGLGLGIVNAYLKTRRLVCLYKLEYY